MPEPECTIDGDRRILKAASLKQVITIYGETTPDSQALRHLVLAHAHFVPSATLLDQIIKAYKRASQETASKARAQVQFRLVNIVKTWVELAYGAIVDDPATHVLLDDFLQFVQSDSASVAAYIQGAIDGYKLKQAATVRV